ncbi:MAG: pyridoxal-dependent decarboxylase [Planctomycetota bacterium]
MSQLEQSHPGKLDPSDWEEMRSIGHAMIDDMLDYLRNVRDRPAWQSPSAEARSLLMSPTPRTGRPLAAVYEEFKSAILPYPTGNIHPRFWGWVMGNGTPVGMLAELLGGAMNCHVSGYDQSATLVEKQVIGWLVELMDFPEDADGLLVSGGTVANLIGLTVARNHALTHEVRKAGIGGSQTVVYASTQTHGWLDRSCDILGLGESSIRTIAVDENHCIRTDDLRQQIDEDRADGLNPICIVGNAGTVSCGATDDLNALADLAKHHGIWLHIDGAFGALTKLSPKYRVITDGLERADSIAFDLHKWGYMQYELGVVLVKNGNLHDGTFEFSPTYLDKFRGGIAPNPTEFASKGIQLSRGFRALKAWMQFSTYGTDAIGSAIEQNIDQVEYLRKLIASTPNLEQVGPSTMNVVCFRYVPEGKHLADTDEFNIELLVRIQESGLAVPSNARIEGVFALRVAHTNHRSTFEDFDVLIEAVTDIAEGMLAKSD